MSIIKLSPVKIKQQDQVAYGDDFVILPADTLQRRIMIFSFVVVGILAQWCWPIALAYLDDPLQPLPIGNFPTNCVRLLISICIAALIFLSVYEKLYHLPKEDWTAYFRAFQYGFFWQAIFYGLAQTFN